MKVFLLSLLLFFLPSKNQPGKSGRYYIAGFTYLFENPELVVANQVIVVNHRDTIYSDVAGRYVCKVYWATTGFRNTPVYSLTSPEYIVFNVGEDSFVVKNDPKRYAIESERKNSIPMFNFNIPVRKSSLSKGSSLVDLSKVTE